MHILIVLLAIKLSLFADREIYLVTYHWFKFRSALFLHSCHSCSFFSDYLNTVPFCAWGCWGLLGSCGTTTSIQIVCFCCEHGSGPVLSGPCAAPVWTPAAQPLVTSWGKMVETLKTRQFPGLIPGGGKEWWDRRRSSSVCVCLLLYLCVALLYSFILCIQ